MVLRCASFAHDVRAARRGRGEQSCAGLPVPAPPRYRLMRIRALSPLQESKCEQRERKPQTLRRLGFDVKLALAAETSARNPRIALPEASRGCIATANQQTEAANHPPSLVSPLDCCRRSSSTITPLLRLQFMP